MSKKYYVVFSVATFFVIVIAVGYTAIRQYLSIGVVDNSITPNVSQTDSIIALPKTAVRYKVDSFVENLYVPWGIAFTSSERMLVTERNGSIRAVNGGELHPDPLITFSEVSNSGEEGLMGIVIDPNYQTNKFIYTALAYGSRDDLKVKILRLKDHNDNLTVDKILIDNIPAATNHAGGRILFGPDNKLYVTTGDATRKQNAQDKDSLSGKILRLNSDGSIPDDNPFPNSYIYSWGHRNPQGLAWQQDTNQLFITEHGPSGNDGPGGGDEVNLVEAGQNYGWPIVHHKQHQDGLIDPLLEFTPAIAPAAGIFYTGEVFPQFQGNFLFAMLKGAGIMRVEFSNNSTIERSSKLPDIDVGRVREIVQGPDGYIYFTTSNRDGRGKARSGDDHIYRLVPE